MVLVRQDAVAGWRTLMGSTDPDKAAEEDPECLRAIYGRDMLANGLHGSSNEESAQKAIRAIFGKDFAPGGYKPNVLTNLLIYTFYYLTRFDLGIKPCTKVYRPTYTQ
ncbi:unnamed protein product [Protopolystoma xenopodis]|uniref:Nucleoside diphosphate kinase-like domain-containing protein n=1 Tax=Protopolystoma xenopodis TaxID=117903 RepID=A0A448XKR4_9PLAT|nr:unnamed protein product [Protopolystoma xenopodis]